MKQTKRVQDYRNALPTDLDASGRSFDITELNEVRTVLESGILNVTRGTAAKLLEQRFATFVGAKGAHACSSGTAAVHAAIAAFDPEPGSEFITSPITDFGAIAPILWQGCIPVFADVDPNTLCLTESTVAACLSARTRGIIVTHLFGNAAPVKEIAELGRSRGISIIEDCSQALGTRLLGKHVGTFGDIGCFSLQQTKHITCGEGGLVVCNDQSLAARIHGFINKSRDYSDAWPDHHFLSMNYRMTELQAAVVLAQLGKLEAAVASRRRMARLLDGYLSEIGWFAPLLTTAQADHSYWRYPIQVIEGLTGPQQVAECLAEQGIVSLPHYQRPAFDWSMMRSRKTFGKSEYPFCLARPETLDYADARFPGVRAGLSRTIVLPWTERHGPTDVEIIAVALRGAVRLFASG